MNRFATLVVVFLLAVSTAAQLREEMIVSVVEVPVVVSRNGESIQGLTQDDFELFVNGQRHPVDYFEVLEFTRTEQTPALEGFEDQRPLTQRRLVLLLFDFGTSSLSDIWRCRGAAEEFVKRASPGDVFGVATLTPARGVQYLVPFTKDRPAVIRAIRTLSRSSANDGFGIATLAAERHNLDPRRNPGGIADSGVRLGGVELSRWSPEARETSYLEAASVVNEFIRESIVAQEGAMDRFAEAESEHFADDRIQALTLVAENMAALEGVKQVLFLSEGKDLMPELKSNMAPMVHLHSVYRRAGVTLNAVDVAGLRSPTGDGWKGPEEALYTLALDTGGFVVGNTGINRAFEQVAKKQTFVYLLGFKPPINQKEDNTITVKVKNQPPLTDVQHRKGYSTTRSIDAERNPLFLADVMLNDLPQNGVTVALRVDPRPQGAALNVDIPGRELLASGRAGRVTVDTFFYVFDESNTVAGWSQKRAVVDIERGRATLEVEPWQLAEGFDLPPGRYVAKALVRIPGEGRIGIARSPFVIAKD